MVKPLFFLTREEAEKILNAEKDVEVSLDLGMSRERVTVKEGYAIIRGVSISLEDLEKIKPERVYFYDNGLYEATIAGENYYKLVPTSDMPTLEISGIRMHRTHGVTPRQDTLAKLRALGRIRGRVLDTCFGLGYTSLFALVLGASHVTAVEIDENVIEIARLNPYTGELFRRKNFELIHGDVAEVIKEMEDEEFNIVIHDPPRISRAGKLYSLEFYRELYRVLRAGGRLFHYTGRPGSRFRKKDIARGVMERLRIAGFKRVRRVNSTLGVVGEKEDSR